MTKPKRKAIPHEVQTEVLTSCRRRCAICYGLDRDTTIKQGQIAHLDDDSSNADLDNLVFLCLEHHDEFDSRRRQSKGLTVGEVRRFRDELHASLTAAFRREVNFGKAGIVPPDDFSGEWLRSGDDEDDSAEIEIQLVAPGRLKITGGALHGRTREDGPNHGELDFEATLSGRVATYTRPSLPDKTYTLTSASRTTP